MNFGVTPPAEIHRYLVCQLLAVVVGVFEVVFLQQRSLVVVGPSVFVETTPDALAVAVARPEVLAVGPRPVAVRVSGGTPQVVGAALGRERRVVAGVLGGVATPAVVGEVVAPLDEGVRVVHADGTPSGRLLRHEWPSVVARSVKRTR